MKQKWIEAFMDTAERFARLSSATKLQVGSVIVKDNRILSIGYNGMPAGWTNDCEFTNEDNYIETKQEVIHAEANAIIKLARDGESGKDSTLFITHAPCIHCAKLIYGAGISKVYYRDTYRDEFGIEFLQKCGIDVEKV
jgi:dCMP deaminase